MGTELSFQVFNVRNDCFYPHKKKNCDMQISQKCRVELEALQLYFTAVALLRLKL